MTDEEQVNQALAELWDIVRCRCHEAYTGRGLHDPDCQCDSTDALQIVTDRLETLTKERERLALAICGGEDAPGYANAQTVETLEKVARDNANATMAEINRTLAAEVKLAKAVEALEEIAGDGNAAGRNPQLMSDKARATLAEIKGDKT